jgi:ribose/xylose/arabinose/galactoside ABC-type transport system permease subunit
VERNLIGRTMAAVGGNQSEAARRLGMNRGSLIVRLKKYGLASGARGLRAVDLRASVRSCSSASTQSMSSAASEPAAA